MLNRSARVLENHVTNHPEPLVEAWGCWLVHLALALQCHSSEIIYKAGGSLNFLLLFASRVRF